MSQENLQTMIMQNFLGVKEVYYGIVQVVNWLKKNYFQQIQNNRYEKKIIILQERVHNLK